MQDIEAFEDLPSGRTVPLNPNVWVDISTMRANTFQLQNVSKDALAWISEPCQSLDGVLMTRQKQMLPHQMRSLILAKGAEINVSLSFPESIKTITQDVFENCKAIKNDRVIGPAKTTSGSVCALEIDELNTIHVLCDSGIYQ